MAVPYTADIADCGLRIAEIVECGIHGMNPHSAIRNPQCRRGQHAYRSCDAADGRVDRRRHNRPLDQEGRGQGRSDEPLFEISTDKVDAEIPSPAAGVVSEIRVKEGETVPVNSVVAVIGAAGAAAAKGSAEDAGGTGSQSTGAAQGDAASGWIADRGGAAEGAGSARAVALPSTRRSAAAAEGRLHLRGAL
jgi:hypothetical protein